MEICICIEELVGIGTKYFGSTNDNTKECFDKLTWNDKRLKPKWQDILICWEQIKNREPEKTEIELLKREIEDLNARLNVIEKK